jgi:hypothetical protein
MMIRPRSRPLPLLVVLTLSLAWLLLASAAAAGPKDAEAQELAKKAIYTDYLGTKFADAEKKLKQAIAICNRGNACAPKVKARILCDLAVIYIGGMNKVDDGKAQFVAALKLDPSITPDPDLVSPEIEAAFAEAKKSGGEGPSSGSKEPKEPAEPDKGGGSGDMVHTAPAEQATHTPLPLYAELPSGQSATKLQLNYKPFGGEWKSMTMKPLGKGYSAEIGCNEVGTAEGALAYYIQAFDSEHNLVSFSGSRSAPNKVLIQNSISGEAPHLPDRSPPAKCPDAIDCPPDFPGGCPGAKTPEERPCDPDKPDDTDCKKPEAPVRKNWLSLAVQLDWMIVPGNSTACGGSGSPFFSPYQCYYPSGSMTPGQPYNNIEYDGPDNKGGAAYGDTVKGGPALATVRILAGYDRVIGNFTLGVRAGVALRGGPSGFLPFHGEARVAFWFGHEPFARSGVRPYVLVNGGVAQVEAAVGVKVYDCGTTNATPASCLPKYQQEVAAGNTLKLDAWKPAGNGFIGGGLGMLVAISPRHGPFLEAKFAEFIPIAAPGFNLQAGYAFGF